MSRRVRTWLALVGIGLLVAALLTGYSLLRAVHRVQPFYVAALDVDPHVLAGASREMESRVAALYSDAVQQPTWQAVFSETEVNGWLAIALAEKHSELLPETIVDPRVAFAEGECQVGFRFHDEQINTVLSVRVSAFVADSDEVAIRILQAHAGTLPVPVAKIVEAISNLALKQQIPLRWSQQNGDPVALIPLQGILSTSADERQLEALEIHEGELVLAGRTVTSEISLAGKTDDTIKR